MCGVAGCLLSPPLTGDLRDVSTLLRGVRQRGPDDEGVVLVQRCMAPPAHFRTENSVPALNDRLPGLTATEPRAAAFDVAIVHARYAIIDLSPNAHQPFPSRDGSLIAAWNGEIYNYRELREDLSRQGISFRSASDTEVLVEGYRRWGDDLWPRLNGFWAVVLYDTDTHTLVLARDRMGVAPLYYRETDAGLFFASLIRPLLDVREATRFMDREAVRGFLAAGMKDIDEATTFRDVRSFPAGVVLRFPPGVCRVRHASMLPFWRYPAERLTARDLSIDEAAVQLRELLTDAVALRRRSDRPVAFELSGGLDSSSIVACAAAASEEPVPTYTIQVPERDEEPFARVLRTRYTLDYRVLRGLEDSFGDEALTFARTMEEPYHSPNVFTCFAMRREMQRAGFAVVISGSGGDEALAGYEYELWSAAAAHLRRSGRAWHAFCHAVGMHLGSGARLRLSAAELIGWAKQRIRPNHSGAAGIFPPASTSHLRAEALRHGYTALPFSEQLLFHFQVAHLPYYLRSSDHFTMSLPLEHRFPFLDYRLVEFSLRLPLEYLFRNGWTKYVLRRAMAPLLPPRLVWRREKVGFPFPLQRFLAASRAALIPLTEAVVAAGIIDGPVNFDALILRDPDLLWRVCSTGYWLETT